MTDSILNAGSTLLEEGNEQYLVKDNYLSEFESDSEKTAARENLNVYPKDSLYTKEEVITLLQQYINSAINNYLQMDDPHGILSQVEDMISGMVKQDGSVPFTSAQSGQTPYKDEHLTTKKYVDQKIQDHLDTPDPHGILEIITAMLNSYVKSSDIYSKTQLYTQSEIDKLLKSYVKQDGSVPFTSAQIGKDPTIDSHLATKRYADKILYNHLIDVDPHHFITILNQRLASYAKTNNVYNKTETYSRTQLDSIINSVVQQFVELTINDYQTQINNSILEIQKNYVKSDGTVPFTSPQKGIDAVETDELVTLKQLQNLEQDIINIQPEWITSGAAGATVGMVEEGTEFPSTVSFQEIMDAIFYGQTVSISVPEYTNIGETCEITVCVHGSLSLVSTVHVYQNDELIYTFTKEVFENRCITVDSNPITEDTIFRIEVIYENEVVHDNEATTKVSYPIFVGLLPKWKPANTITMDYLKQLETEDIDGTQNRFFTYGQSSITFKYVFEDASLRHPFVVTPLSHPDLVSMTTAAQTFSIDAFEIIDMIPLTVDGATEDIIYKIYVYKQALASLNQEVTYNFENNE